KLPFYMKATWYSSPAGSQSPDFSRRRMVSSYCSLVTSGAAVKRTSMLVLRASRTGVSVGLVAMSGLLRMDASGLSRPTTEHVLPRRLAGEDSEPEGRSQRITLPDRGSSWAWRPSLGSRRDVERRRRGAPAKSCLLTGAPDVTHPPRGPCRLWPQVPGCPPT